MFFVKCAAPPHQSNHDGCATWQGEGETRQKRYWEKKMNFTERTKKLGEKKILGEFFCYAEKDIFHPPLFAVARNKKYLNFSLQFFLSNLCSAEGYECPVLPLQNMRSQGNKKQK